jgi:acetolactate synthase-1/2/3 large subunit
VSDVPFTPRTGGDAVVAALAMQGVDTVFGLPGVQLDGLFNAFHDGGNALRIINARHEQGVAYMALGYAHATGRPGVYACVPGPGLLNTGAALSTAYAGGVPVVALIGQIPTRFIGEGGGELHELPDQTGIIARLTRWNGIAMAPDEVSPVMNEAFARLAAGPGPVAVELPADVLKAGLLPEAATQTPGPVPVPFPGENDIEQAARIIAAARTPLIVVGGGAIGAVAEVNVLSARLEAPVLSHLQGRGIVDSASPYSVGRAEGARLWPSADVIVAIGTRFNSPRKAWRLRPGQKVVRIDIDAAQFGRGAAPDAALHGDARAVTAALLARLPAAPSRPSRREEMRRLKADIASVFNRSLGPQMAYVRALRSALPPEATIVCDYTQVAYVATAAFDVHEPRRLVTPGYQGTLGFAYATALGAKVGRPDHPAVALCGDGGFLFTGNELATAAQHGIAAIAVVFSDGAYGNVRRMQEDLYGGRVVASELRNPDFVKYAEAFGVAARRAEGPAGLSEALRWAQAERGPTLIEVPVGKMPDPWDLLEPVLD